MWAQKVLHYGLKSVGLSFCVNFKSEDLWEEMPGRAWRERIIWKGKKLFQFYFQQISSTYPLNSQLGLKNIISCSPGKQIEIPSSESTVWDKDKSWWLCLSVNSSVIWNSCQQKETWEKNPSVLILKCYPSSLARIALNSHIFYQAFWCQCLRMLCVYWSILNHWS